MDSRFKGKKLKSMGGWSGYLNNSILSYNYSNSFIVLGKTSIYLNTFSKKTFF